jgi:hypothetical protein
LISAYHNTTEFQEVWAGPSCSSIALKYWVDVIMSVHPFISHKTSCKHANPIQKIDFRNAVVPLLAASQFRPLAALVGNLRAQGMDASFEWSSAAHSTANSNAAGIINRALLILGKGCSARSGVVLLAT